MPQTFRNFAVPRHKRSGPDARDSTTIRSLNQSIASRTAQIDGLAHRESDLSRRKVELEAVRVKAAPAIPEANRADIDRLALLQARRFNVVEQIAQFGRQAGVLDNVLAKYEILAADIEQFNRDVSEMLSSAGVADLSDCLVPAPPARAVEMIKARRSSIAAEVSRLQGTPSDTSEDTVAGIDRVIALIRANMTLAENKQREYEKNQADRKKLEAVIAGLERDIREINEVQKPKRTEEQQSRMEAYLDAIGLLGQETKVLADLYRPLHNALASANETAKRLGFVSQVVFDSEGHASRGMDSLIAGKALSATKKRSGQYWQGISMEFQAMALTGKRLAPRSNN